MLVTAWRQNSYHTNFCQSFKILRNEKLFEKEYNSKDTLPHIISKDNILHMLSLQALRERPTSGLASLLIIVRKVTDLLRRGFIKHNFTCSFSSCSTGKGRFKTTWCSWEHRMWRNSNFKKVNPLSTAAPAWCIWNKKIKKKKLYKT